MSMEEGLTKRCWLHMLAEGGRWSVRDLAMDMGVTAQNVQNTVTRMHDLGSIKRHEKTETSGKSITYSVAKDCRLPSNLTLQDLLTALHKAGETV